MSSRSRPFPWSISMLAGAGGAGLTAGGVGPCDAAAICAPRVAAAPVPIDRPVPGSTPLPPGERWPTDDPRLTAAADALAPIDGWGELETTTAAITNGTTTRAATCWPRRATFARRAARP